MIIESPKGDPRWAQLAVDDLFEKVRSKKKFRSLKKDLHSLRELIGELVDVAHEKFVQSSKPDVHTEHACEGEHLLIGEQSLSNGLVIRAASDVDRNIIQVWVEEVGYFSKKKQYSCVREFENLVGVYEYMNALESVLEPKKDIRTRKKKKN